jgi:DNA processing protein
MSSRTVHSERALAWLGLALTDGLSPRMARELVGWFGTPEGVLRAGEGRLRAAGLAPALAGTIAGARARALEEARRIAAAGASLLTLDDALFPRLLREIPDPPVALAVRGALAPDESAVAVVGARRASEYGRRVAEELGQGLAQAGLTVVSGLAAGIDAAAHRGALEAGGRTVAVLGTGIDRVYPSWHADLAAQIVARGALLTEFACGTPPLAFHFPRRNRVISGLTLGTVVVEAAEQSGSLITARYAIEQNRAVLAVPGPVGRAAHRGPHRLIQEGAKLVTGVEDVLEELAPTLIGRLGQRRRASAAAGLTEAERRILAAVGPEGLHVDEVIRQATVPAGCALETLLALELRGLVDQLPGKRFRRHAA